MRIRAFQGLRPETAWVDRLAALPYDVVTTEEARQLAEGNPLSLLHVTRPEIGFPPGTDPYADLVYARAVDQFHRLCREGWLVREDASCLYVYRQEMKGHTQTGVMALSLVEDYDSGLIKKHERTRQDKEDDRTRLTNDLSANAGPVFLTYRGTEAIDRLVAAESAREPLFDFVAPDQIRHTVWRVACPRSLQAAFESVPCAYIADGHHRAASAARVGRERRLANPSHTGEEAYNAFLSVLFPASQLKILPYNRLVKDLGGLSTSEFTARLEAAVGALRPADGHPRRPGEVHLFLDQGWRAFTLPAQVEGDPASSLDVSRLQSQVLGPLLGIDDPRTNPRIEFVGGIRGLEPMEDAVRSGRQAVAFSLHPVTVEALMAIADAGSIMPPKSTWFEPKLRSGLVIHTF